MAPLRFLRFPFDYNSALGDECGDGAHCGEYGREYGAYDTNRERNLDEGFPLVIFYTNAPCIAGSNELFYFLQELVPVHSKLFFVWFWVVHGFSIRLIWLLREPLVRFPHPDPRSH